MQHSRQHLKSIPNSALPEPDSVRGDNFGDTWYCLSICYLGTVCAGTQWSPPLTCYRHRKNGGKGSIFFFFFKCSTSKSITCILWVKPARHKATHRLVEQTLWLFCHELSFGIAKFLVFVRQIRAGCAAQTRGIFGSGKSSFHLRQSPKGKIIKRLQDSTSPNW